MNDKPRMSFAQMLRDIDDAELDPFEFRIWVHIWRVGVSWESLRTMARKCGMSVGKTSQARAALIERNFLAYTEKNGRLGLTAVLCLADAEESQPIEERQEVTGLWAHSDYVKARAMGANGTVCVYCGSDQVKSLDHWMPRSRGGTDAADNLVPSCEICNFAKSTMSGDEFVTVLMARKWLNDDRSPHEQTQQSNDVDVHHTNSVFTTRTACSPHEQSVHHMNAILSMPNEVSNMKGEGDRANGRGELRPSSPPIVIQRQPDRTPGGNGHQPPEEPPVEKRPLEPEKVAVEQMATAITDVTGMAFRLNWSKPDGNGVGDLAYALVADGYTADQVRRHYSRQPAPGAWNWYEKDWRGKKGETPTPRGIRETIAGATHVAVAVKKTSQIERALAMFGDKLNPATS